MRLHSAMGPSDVRRASFPPSETTDKSPSPLAGEGLGRGFRSSTMVTNLCFPEPSGLFPRLAKALP